MSAIDMQAAVNAFLVEGRELAQQLEQGLLSLEQGHDPNDAEFINAMFRAAHTIKGSAGIVGIDSLTRFTHRVETLLDRVRAGEPLLNSTMITQLLRCCDHIHHLLDLAEQGDNQAEGLKDTEQTLLASLDIPSAAIKTSNTAAVVDVSAPCDSTAQGFRLFAVFGKDSLRDGMDPASALLYLGERVKLEQSVLHTPRIPAIDKLNPEDCWIAMAAQASEGSLQEASEAFEFFLDRNMLILLPADATAQQVYQALTPMRDCLGDAPPKAWVDAKLIHDGEWMLLDKAADSPAKVQASTAHANTTNSSRFVRVPAERLDELIVQVGELVIASAGVEVLSRETRNTRLQEAVSLLMNLVDGIQSGTLHLRMVPIGETFSRFQRVVRDVSKELGKSITLDIVGGDTELDKAMVERIGDPLMHLVRNAMDHGLETPAERLAAGKPEQGTLRLRAFHESGNVIIEVSDDGRGLNRDRILKKAIDKGLITSGDGLSDQEVNHLIFEPGFSTAEQITNLSGRGVGMDVVKKSIESLRGAITLNSRWGEGTLLQMRLPLTLAIIDGFMVGVGKDRFIVPLDLVVECIELPADALMPDRPKYLNLRGEVLPYVCLRETFGIEAEGWRRPSVVVVRSGEIKTGILVDSLHGEIQTVIKPMSGIFRHLRYICGTSILGTGNIALILDANQLVQGSIDQALRNSASAVNNL
jgi:two-component system, chemotaxis family, sensor kinase CheA